VVVIQVKVAVVATQVKVVEVNMEVDPHLHPEVVVDMAVAVEVVEVVVMEADEVDTPIQILAVLKTQRLQLLEIVALEVSI